MSIPLAARFRAIITGPLDGSRTVVDPLQNAYDAYGGIRFQDLPSTTKRKRETSEHRASKKPRRTADDDGGGTKEPTTSYRSRDDMMSAMQERFKQASSVDFHGTYEVVDPDTTHKARIQTVANEIWKATGYRFTVKDHPQFTNGHKTRFWCSQDEAHRSKSSRAARKAQGDLYKPRQTSAGEVLAKNRFPCKSRLLISSRDSNSPGEKLVLVRMHHHIAHEPYVDLNLPPDIAQGVWNSYAWLGRGVAGPSSPPTKPGTLENSTQPLLPIPQYEDQSPLAEHTPPEQDTYDELQQEMRPGMTQEMHTTPIMPNQTDVLETRAPAAPLPQPTSTPQLIQQSIPLPSTHIFHGRMQTHIRNLREFCDGLEYQLQFNDYRMLDVLEREGGSFLNLVADCLQKEGRLVSPEQQPALVSPPPPVHPIAAHTNIIGGVVPALNVLKGLQVPQSYKGNPGINPQALGR